MRFKNVLKIFVVIMIFPFFKSLVAAQNYVQISNCDNPTNSYDFRVNGSSYKPLVCNYLIEFLTEPNGAWYISPSRQYTSNGMGDPWHWEYDPDNPTNSVVRAKDKLLSDFIRIKNLGFTEIRICGAGLQSDNGTYTYPTGDKTTYLNLLDGFLNQVNNAGLRVIFLLGQGSEYLNKIAFKNFISEIAKHLANNTAIMAYDLYNEPGEGNRLWFNYSNDKYYYAKMVSEWNNCIKKWDPNHLITIGLQNPIDLFAFDPLIMPIDFISYHFYTYDYSDLNKSKDIMDTYLYWVGKTINRPWIIGETGYSSLQDGTGNDAQKEYAQYTMQKSLDCNCKGYSWWQYQETKWGDNDPQDYMGLFKRYAGDIEGVAKPIADPAHSPFLNYANSNQIPNNCALPTDYYTILNGTEHVDSGYVKDNDGNPIPNAVVEGKEAFSYKNYYTFTNSEGYYQISSEGPLLAKITVTYPGYSTTSIENFQDYIPKQRIDFTLTKTINNSWAKLWTNNSLYCINMPEKSWQFSSNDKYYQGDFDGDGQQDILCVKYTSSNQQDDRMAIYTYSYNCIGHSISSGWKLLWDNQGNPNAGGGIYPYRNVLVIGDFNGDHKDDVIGFSGWTTWFSFNPNNNPLDATWLWMDSDYGNSNNAMGVMAPYSNNVIAGDFYNSGKSAIMGVSAGGWITTFQLINGVWTWIQSNQGRENDPTPNFELSYLKPYSSNRFITGDFDGDGQNEILGNIFNGTIALFKPTWDNSRSNWKWVNSNNTPYWKDDNNSSGIFPYKDNLFVGNFDSDKNYELLGLNSTFCVAFDFINWTDNTCNLVWDGSYYNTISDWKINDPGTSKYFFINTDLNTVNNQQQLFALRNINDNGNFSINLYTFRPNPESTWPCSTLP